jgi:phosphoglycerate dehydrogenase-like enzyme
MKIVVPEYIDIPGHSTARMERLGAAIYTDKPDQKLFAERVGGAEIIICRRTLGKTEIDMMPRLRFIIVPAVGWEGIDLRHATTKGVRVLNCPTHNSIAVAEHAIALLFAVKRKIVEAAVTLRKGSWDHRALKGTETHGKKLGLIGYGRIGKQVAVMAKGLGMDGAYVNTASGPADVDNLVKASDVVCLCLPLNDSTRHLMDKRRLGLLQPHAVLINVGRGATIDQKALLQILAEKRIAGAGLDVFENEPLTGKPTREIIALANLPNVVATSHLAYKTEETAQRLGKELLGNLQSCLANKPINVIN